MMLSWWKQTREGSHKLLILDNSLKFTKLTRGKEKIHIISEKKDNQVTVSIMDTGIGDRPGNISNIFKIYSKSFSELA